MSVKALYKLLVNFPSEECARLKFPVTDFTRLIRGFAKNDDISVVTHRDDAVDKNQVVISGLYDPDKDQDGERSITIFVSYNPKQKFIQINKLDWKKLSLSIVEVIGHETIHQRQWRSRKFDAPAVMFHSNKKDAKVRSEQMYYGDPDEIDAYAYSIAIEVHILHRKLLAKHIFATDVYKTYKRLFGAEHPIVQQLAKLTMHYYNHLIGEPYAEKAKQFGR